MPSAIRLTSSEQRIWRGNGMTWVDSAGKTLRPLTDVELGKVAENRSRRRETTLTEAGVTYSPTPTRDLFKKMLFEKHGAVIVQSINGKFQGRLSDPTKARPTTAQSAAMVPPAKNCQCRDWGAAPGQLGAHALKDLHHPACINAHANPKVEVKLEVVETVEQVEPVRIPEPKDCTCKDWARPLGWNPANHHPICEWREPWEAINGGAPEMWLVDMVSTKRLRKASREEIDLAMANLEETGAPLVEIDGTSYGVISDKSLDARAQEELVKEEVPEELESAEWPGMVPSEDPLAALASQIRTMPAAERKRFAELLMAGG